MQDRMPCGVTGQRVAAGLIGGIALLAATSLSTAARAADVVLAGAVTAASGEKLGGVTVSAKADGATVTTSVFTDESGHYVFPPLAEGQYRVWAQALDFDIAKTAVKLGDSRKADFTLKPLTDFETRVRQLPGDLILAGLPEENDTDKRMKRIFRNNCTSCHTPSFTLQHSFDANGWNAIVQTMKLVTVYGVYRGPDTKPNPVIDFHQKELAAYLARARGENGAFKIVSRPRPSGEAARAVFREYDVALNPDLAMPTKDHVNDGSDWTKGSPSRVGSMPHDAAADNDGHLWFAAVSQNRTMSVGRIDRATGEVQGFKVEGANGNAASAHGLIRDQDGTIWFNVHLAKGGLAKIDPKTSKIAIYVPPSGMSPIDGPVTLDFDGQGGVWAGTLDGVLRFDPKTESFAEFKSKTARTAIGGLGSTYGIAGDRDGNVWWTQMAFDTIAKSDVREGTAREWKLPMVKDEYDRTTEADRKFYEGYAPRDIGTPFPWSQGPRRIGIDRNADVLWVAESWGGALTRVDTRSFAMTTVPLPNPTTDQPYSANVDQNHNVWTPMWTTDRIGKYDPEAKTWTMFDLPTRGTEVRISSMRQLPDGKTEVVFAYPRSSKVAVLTVRSAEEIKALEAQAGK